MDMELFCQVVVEVLLQFTIKMDQSGMDDQRKARTNNRSVNDTHVLLWGEQYPPPRESVAPLTETQVSLHCAIHRLCLMYVFSWLAFLK